MDDLLDELYYDGPKRFSAARIAAEEALGLAGDGSGEPFHPPFIFLGAAELPLYRAVLREGVPGALPLKA